jgi:hypothetical protein
VRALFRRLPLYRRHPRLGDHATASQRSRLGASAASARYDGSVLCRLAVIDVAQRAGLSLAEISELVQAGN